MSKYTVGLDYGTNSVRALIVDVATGEEVGTSVCNYATGDRGIVLDAADPNLARQHPRDYVEGLELSVQGALAEASAVAGFRADAVIGMRRVIWMAVSRLPLTSSRLYANFPEGLGK